MKKSRRFLRWTVPGLLCFVLLLTHPVSTEAGLPGKGPEPLEVQILGINDLHGQLNVTRNVGGKPAGRADFLAAHLRQREAENPDTLLVHSGDMVGASAPVSALMQDEPTIEILNELGFDVGTVGNHEFDRGVEEMLRLIHGGKHEKTGVFEGADFPYTVANVLDETTGEPILPPPCHPAGEGHPHRLHRSGDPGNADHRDSGRGQGSPVHR